MWLLVAAAAAASDGCGSAPRWRRGETVEVTLPVKHGPPRQYLLTLPTEYKQRQPYPLVFGFHGWSSSAEHQAAYDGFVEKAKRGSLIAVHPQGLGDVPRRWRDAGKKYQGWSAVGSSMESRCADDICLPTTTPGTWPCHESCGKCSSHCSYTSCADDVSFVTELLNELEHRLCIDTAKVFAHGSSNGGQMVLELLQSRVAARFAAMVSEVGLPHAHRFVQPGAKTRFLGLWGDRDKIMPPITDDSSQVTVSRDGFFYNTADNVTRTVAAHLGCSADRHSLAVHSNKKNLRCEAHSCQEGDAVHCMFSGGHIWPMVAHAVIYQFYFNELPAAVAADVDSTAQHALLRGPREVGTAARPQLLLRSRKSEVMADGSESEVDNLA